MKKVVLSLAILAAGFAVKAQDENTGKVKFSAGAEASLPVGTFSDSYSFGVGGSLQGDYAVTQKFEVGLNAGYISYSGKTITTPSYVFFGVTVPGSSYKVSSLGLIPVLAGGKYNFSEKVFASAQLGVSFATGSGNSGSSFTYVPGVGYNFSKNISALAKYTGWSKNGTNSSAIGLRVAYTF